MLKPDAEKNWLVKNVNTTLVAGNDSFTPGGHTWSDRHNPLMEYRSTKTDPYNGSCTRISN
jgi:hypothetical protein